VVPGKECFVATAKVYAHYTNPIDQYLSEATASRGLNPFKPSVSPREWAQTAALGIALRNAGFGLQFNAAGDSIDEPAINELGQTDQKSSPLVSDTDLSEQPDDNSVVPEDDPIEKAKKTPCPIKKYSGKTLGDIIAEEPGAIVWAAQKFTENAAISAAAKLLCEYSAGNAGQ